ncbi:hypothetical protein J2X97_000809 [Epilithonimonas hungarica]|jgi:hypothetical protein|uniref:DUF5675 family protein n=1 Tax=Epilithonimonas hungarica TaxID=454006 RepID=UPI00277EB324|nr:DUF5675 family protein [Epilithonimonas hungarica]MDP9955172.1 hypothetical protein [Epilithonimonas hungarica]
MALVLKRQYLPSGTNGILSFDGHKICKTIELPWRDNQRKISCIPEGTYRLKKRFSPKFKWHLEVMNVQNRDLILFHPANNALKELNGCIAPVMELSGEGKGLRSRVAFERLKEVVFPYLEKGHNIKLTIKKDVQ